MSKSIWFKAYSLEELHQRFHGTMADSLGIRVTEIGADFIRGTMPTHRHTVQPLGFIHGGANVTLAESLASIGANMVVNRSRFFCVGQEVNANHLRSVREGLVTGIARPEHIGKKSQVWSIRLFDDQERLSCISRLTLAVIEQRS